MAIFAFVVSGLDPQDDAASARRLAAALDQLAEAVTVHDVRGKMLYANGAAVRLLGFQSADELLSAEPGSIMSRYVVLHPDGSPVSPDQLPGRKAVLGQDAEPLLVRWFTHGSTPRWSVIKASPLRDGDGSVTGAVNVMEDVTEVKEAELTQRLLAEAASVLGGSLDYEETLRRVADLAVPDLADWCSVDVVDERGGIQLVGLSHVDPEKVRFGHELRRRYPTDSRSDRGVAGVLRSGRTELVQGISDDMLAMAARDAEHFVMLRQMGLRSVLVVPMVAGTGVLGALTLVLTEAARWFSVADVALAEELGRRAGEAVEKARLYTERGRIAQALQASLLPPELPDMTGWRSATLFRAAGVANEVGGDFYDAQPCGGDGFLVMVGDVAGKGAAAAAMTPRVRHTLNAAVALTGDLSGSLRHVNESLLSAVPRNFCSVAAALLRDRPNGEGRASICCAGHPAPVLADADRVRLVGDGSTVLGALAQDEWPVVDVDLGHGDVLVLYTDGVTDAVGEDGRFGQERLLEVVRGAADRGAAGIVEALDEALAGFQRGPQRDDIAVLAVERGEAVQAAAWTVSAEPAHVGPLRKEIVDFAATVGVPQEQLYDIRLAVSEALTNVVVHAYREAPGAGDLHVEARRVGDELEVVVLDDGLGMAPRVDSPGLGLGVPVISMLTGSHRFSQRRTGHGTRLCMRFSIPDPPEPPA